MKFTPLGLSVLLTAAALGQLASPTSNARPELILESADGMGEVELDRKTNVATARNGVVVRYGTAVLTAKSVRLNPESTQLEAEGDVSIQQTRPDGGTVLWRGQRVRYDYVRQTIEAEQFRFGQPPFYAGGDQVKGGKDEHTQTAINAFVTVDDVADPGLRIKAKTLTVTDNKSITAENATVFAGPVPVFYYPKLTETLGERRFYWTATPGYQNTWGAFMLGAYHQNWNKQVQTALELDYYTKRGPGVGPSVSYDLDRWGKGDGQFYYLNDRKPGTDSFGNPISEHRDRVYLNHFSNPWEDFYGKAAVRYQSDPNLIHDFFQDEYRANVQPLTIFEGQQLWQNYTLGVSVVPQVNAFQEQVERLPELSFNGARQQIGPTPFYYESQNTAGYLAYRGGDSSSTNYSAFRADSYHQITLPVTAFGWLNVAPRVGGRFTHYSETDGLDLGPEDRWMFNTGAEMSAKASALWKDARNEFWDVNGVRHVIQPSVNYAYVPTPNVLPSELPQFDRRVPSLELTPVEFPDNNSIDSLNYRNVVRLSVLNLFQTKRAENVQPFVSWQVYDDWNVGELQYDQSQFSDVYSRFLVNPRDWITYGNLVRYDPVDTRLAEYDNLIKLTPNDVVSWTFGSRYLIEDPNAGAIDSNLFFSSVGYRMNENWSVRMTQQFEARTKTMEAQYYTLARDFRSWIGALTVRILDNGPNGVNWTVGVAFQLKAFGPNRTTETEYGPNRLLGTWN